MVITENVLLSYLFLEEDGEKYSFVEDEVIRWNYYRKVDGEDRACDREEAEKIIFLGEWRFGTCRLDGVDHLDGRRVS